MLIPMSDLRRRFGVNPKGILHLGGHTGEEADDYSGVPRVVWFECNPLVLSQLLQNTILRVGHYVIEAAVSDVDGQLVEFNVSSNNASSSILKMKRHRDYYPGITESHRLSLWTRTVDTLLPLHGESPEDFDFANLDLQGAELKALRGMRTCLPYLKWIYTEVNFEELYDGCALVDELDSFLYDQGFLRVETVDTGCGWGDAIYVRKPEKEMLPESWTLYPETLANYRNPVFVETGTHLGGGIAVALNVGFEEIHSVDIEPHLYQNALRLYSANPKVRLYHGNAATLVKSMIDSISHTITFWLDAHDGLTSTLWPELHAIASHPIKTHTILIDDRQWWKTWRLEEAHIRNFLLTVNPNYKFLHEPNKYAPDDIFVATI